MIEEHMNMFFTEKGFDILYKYTQSLIKIWYKKKEKDYPFTTGIVLGIPSFNFTKAERIYNNQSELTGRIKGYMQLMCVSKIEVDLGQNSKLIFDIR